MSDEGSTRRTTDPHLTAVPRDLRPFVRDLPTSDIIRPGDDPILDAAVAKLKELNGGGNDPLYPGVHKVEPGPTMPSERKVYVAPWALPGAETPREAKAKGERKRRGVIVGIAAVGIGVAGLVAMMGRGGRVEREGEPRAAGVVEERAPRGASAADAGAVAVADAGTAADAGAGARVAMSSAAAPSTRRAPAPARPAVRAPKASQRDKPAKEVAPPPVETPQADPLDGAMYR
jgi:hypothetical protein